MGGGLAVRARGWWAAGFCVVAIWLGACATTTGGDEYIVRRGDTLYEISRRYEVPVAVLREANGIEDVRALQIGQRLVIPGSGSGAAGSARASQPKAARAVRAAPRPNPNGAQRITDLEMVWPVSARPTSTFGRRHGRSHDGIDIPAKAGTPVVAAEAGRVIHSGVGLGDYGQVVIVKHAGRYSTVYAHNRKNHVRTGDFVEKGEVIAEVGTTGNASGPHVHFEVRRDRKPRDPLEYLP